MVSLDQVFIKDFMEGVEFDTLEDKYSFDNWICLGVK